MIVDCILNRYEGSDYNAHDFYINMVQYGGYGVKISRAMDFGTEDDVRRELCRYIDANDYNPLIKGFINKADWLTDDKGTNWKSQIDILGGR